MCLLSPPPLLQGVVEDSLAGVLGRSYFQLEMQQGKDEENTSARRHLGIINNAIITGIKVGVKNNSHAGCSCKLHFQTYRDGHLDCVAIVVGWAIISDRRSEFNTDMDLPHLSLGTNKEQSI